MRTPSLFNLICVFGFIAAQVGSMLCFKLVAEKRGGEALKLFIIGNFIGFLCTVFLPLALKNQNPNLIYALCLGGGFCFLQFFSYFLFRVPLSPLQWSGVGCVAFGMILLNLK